MTTPADLSALISRLLALKLLPRTGWLQRGIAPAESIADHSYSVALLALICGDLIGDLDHEKLLRIALLHDAAEALTGDIPASVRDLFGAGIKRDVEDRAFSELFAALPTGRTYRALWQEYADGSSREARLVKVLDRIELMAQALAHEQTGVRTVDPFWPADERFAAEFPPLVELAAALRAQRPPR